MYFYIDETGQTGSNLLDDNQPNFYYGMLSTPYDLDQNKDSYDRIIRMRKKLQVSELHANELGIHKIELILDDISDFLDDFNIDFNIFSLNKKDFIIINFFDQVFDSGVNRAVSYIEYWSQLRYCYLYKLRTLFNDKVLEILWKARGCKDKDKSNRLLVQGISCLLNKLDSQKGLSEKSFIKETLEWAKNNPDELLYNFISSVEDRENKDVLSPNSILFQLVLFSISEILPKNSSATIYVDKQNQFNRYQNHWAEVYKNFRLDSLPATEMGMGLNTFDTTNMPLELPLFIDSNCSVGLEIVDILTWLVKRYMENKKSLSERLILFVDRMFQDRMKQSKFVHIDILYQEGLMKMKEQLENAGVVY